MGSVRQANFLIPEEVLAELRSLVPRGEQSVVVSQALQRELKRRRLQIALQKSFGAWGTRKDLGATKAFIKRLRKERAH